MDIEHFEGSLVLEKLAELDLVDRFLAAVDADDFREAARLMKRAGLERESMEIVVWKMRGSE